MRKASFLMLVVIGLCLLAGSCRYNYSPEATTKKFLISFNQMDFQKAKSYSTPGTWDVLNIMAEATKNVSEEQKTGYSKSFFVSILGTKSESDSVVIVTFKTVPKRLPFNHFKLFKTINRRGQTRWKVDISTLDLLNSEKKQDNFLMESQNSSDSLDSESK